jgi:hypothetical protein
MAKRKRNYRLEYLHRLERARKRGLSKSQARGHPKAGETSISAKARAALRDARLQQGLRALRKGESLADAARSAGLSPERLRKFITDRKIGRKHNGKWQLIKHRLRWEWAIFTEGTMVFIVVSDPATNSLIGSYLNAVRLFLNTNDASLLKRFQNVSVKDAAGRKYRLETNPNTLYRLDLAERETPEEHYKFALSERE